MIRKHVLALSVCITAMATAESNFITHNQTLPFDQSIDEVKAHLETACSDIILHQNQTLELPTATTSQVQIDCTDYAPMNHQGLTEWVFADNRLDIVWLLTPLSELNKVKNTLENDGIQPDYALDAMADFYLDRGFGIRYEPTELLYHSERLTPFYRAWLESL